MRLNLSIQAGDRIAKFKHKLMKGLKLIMMNARKLANENSDFPNNYLNHQSLKFYMAYTFIHSESQMLKMQELQSINEFANRSTDYPTKTKLLILIGWWHNARCLITQRSLA